METTLDLDDELLAAARDRAAADGVTLTTFVERALATALAPRLEGSSSDSLEWPIRRGRFLGGVDLADRDSLHDAMDEIL